MALDIKQPNTLNPLNQLNQLNPLNPFEADGADVSGFGADIDQVTNDGDGLTSNPGRKDIGPNGIRVVAPTVNQTDPGFESVLEKVLEFLNEYLDSDHGVFTKNHKAKIKKDIKSDWRIGNFIQLNEEDNKVEWKNGQKPSPKEFQHMLFAFRELHDKNSSFYQKLTKLNLPEVGFQIISNKEMNKVVEYSAKPGFGLRRDADQYRKEQEGRKAVATHVVQDPQYKNPMKEKDLVQIIRLFADDVPQLAKVDERTNKLTIKHRVSLNDVSAGDKFKRFFHLVKTDDRIKRVEDGLESALAGYEEKLTKQVEEISSDYNPETVTDQVYVLMADVVKQGHKKYKEAVPKGPNLFDKERFQDSEVFGQVHQLVKQNHEELLTKVTAEYGRSFSNNLTNVVKGYDQQEFFRGKQLDRLAGNVEKINEELVEIEKFNKSFQDLAIILVDQSHCNPTKLNDIFLKQARELRGAIGDKIIDNSRQAMEAFKPELKDVGKPRQDVLGRREIVNLAAVDAGVTAMAKAATTIGQQQLPAWLEPRRQEIKDKAQAVKESMRSVIENYRPRIPGVFKTFISGIAKAFNSTAGRIGLGVATAAGVAAGVAAFIFLGVFAWPLVVAIAAVGVVGVSAWSIKNIQLRFQQREEAKRLLANIDANLQPD